MGKLNNSEINKVSGGRHDASNNRSSLEIVNDNGVFKVVQKRVWGTYESQEDAEDAKERAAFHGAWAANNKIRWVLLEVLLWES